ncbi:MAG: hypothetical protein ACFFCQ_18035 [Promethearchaeota archaeon]
MNSKRGESIVQLVWKLADEINQFWNRYGFISEEISYTGQE